MSGNKANFGMIGLAVMGRNLALNVADHGFRVAVWNLETPVTHAFVAEHGEARFVATTTLADFVASLERPRRIMIMIKAGKPVDEVLTQLRPLLEPGDIVIDGGNTHFAETRRREADLAALQIHFVGMGVSGGEEGARRGPSITIFFFVGLFIVVHGVEVGGLLKMLADMLVSATGGNMEITAYAILWASAILSAIVDNIPFVATMIPLIKAMAPAFGGPDAIGPLWWSLSLGACFGGNGTLIGASANLTVAGLAERNGIPFRFLTYTYYAFPMMLVSIVISHIYIWLRYF